VQNLPPEALRRVGGAKKVGRARAKPLSSARRRELARRPGAPRARALSPFQRREMARHAAVERWSRRPRVATADDAPAAVGRLLEGYRPATLVWADPDHRYLIAREIMVRGDAAAVRWLRSVLPLGEIRELVRRNRGTGCSEPERKKLRKKLRLTAADIPIRPY
jgi:hypothetical protein